MPKPHYADAPAAIKLTCERHRLDAGLDTPNGTATIAAVGTLNWLRACYQRGYDVRPEEVPTPAHDQLATFSGNAAELTALRIRLGFELKYEIQAKRLAESMRKWASEPCEAELAEGRRAKLRADLDQIAIEQRTNQILADAEAARVEKAKIAARRQAEKELAS